MQQTSNLNKLITAIMLVLTLNFGSNAKVQANDSEIFASGGLDYHDEENLKVYYWEGITINTGYSSFFYNNFYYKIEGNVTIAKGFDKNHNKLTDYDRTKYRILGGVGYSTNFYYSPEVKILGYGMFGTLKSYGIGIAISPFSFKFPLAANISILPSITIAGGTLFNDNAFLNIIASLGLSFKL